MLQPDLVTKRKMFNFRLFKYLVCFLSILANIFTVPIATPIIWNDVRIKTADHLIVVAESVRPQSPPTKQKPQLVTKVPPITKEELAYQHNDNKALPKPVELTSLEESSVGVIAHLLSEY